MTPPAGIPTEVAVGLRCAGCGFAAPDEVAFIARCPRATAGDDIDHVMTAVVEGDVRFVADDDPNPFVRFRELSRAYQVARGAGWSDDRYVSLVHRLDRAIASLDGHGFRTTPFARANGLSGALGFTATGGVWVKDETGNVSGSHKARHLMGTMLSLLVAEELDPDGPTIGRPLAIASCGNAALAAAVVAHAAARRLDVFVPPDADPVVLDRLGHLHVRVVTVPREEGESGDPTVRRLREAVAEGAVAFTCQGPDNGLAVEGGATLGYELAEAAAHDDVRLERLVVQVGGGALAAAAAQGLVTAHAFGVIDAVPRLDTVQTTGAAPLRRAWERVGADLRDRDIDPRSPLDPTRGEARAVLEHAARHRSTYMWPWETTPVSVAHGILDDETYDWLAVVRAMLATGGRPLVVDEQRLRAANRLASELTTVDADETGTAGLAGLAALIEAGDVRPDERVAVLFTGIRRGGPPSERSER